MELLEERLNKQYEFTHGDDDDDDSASEQENDEWQE